ncbi:MAG: tetratricopeptide repeat protein [Spirochaetaceae bacterium]|jgi:Flp pilus assembly protein TadD|nr:tetratricopeptide repeat protein [Spirochaetaceae bacterium]
MNNNTFGAKFAFSLFALIVLATVCAVAQSANEYFEKGRLKSMNGEFAEAIQDFTFAANLNPNNPDIYNARGIAYEKLGDYASAQSDYEYAMNLNPDSAFTLHNLRNLAAKMQAKGITIATEYDLSGSFRSQPAAQPVYQQSTAQSAYQQPAVQPAYQQSTAQSAYQQPAVQPVYRQSTAQSAYQQPAAQPAYVMPAAAQTRQGGVIPVNRTVDSYVPVSATKTNLPGQTSNTVNQARVSTPGSPPRFTQSASQQYQTPPVYPYGSMFRQTLPAQKIEQTNEGYNYSTPQSQTRPQTVINPTSKTRITALSNLEQQIFIDPIAGIYNLQGIKLNEYGRFNEAVLQFSEAIKIYPEYAIAYNNRGVAFANIGDFSNAAADFNQALRLNPYYRDAQFNRERAITVTGSTRVAQR